MKQTISQLLVILALSTFFLCSDQLTFEKELRTDSDLHMSAYQIPNGDIIVSYYWGSSMKFLSLDSQTFTEKSSKTVSMAATFSDAGAPVVVEPVNAGEIVIAYLGVQNSNYQDMITAYKIYNEDGTEEDYASIDQIGNQCLPFANTYYPKTSAHYRLAFPGTCSGNLEQQYLETTDQYISTEYSSTRIDDSSPGYACELSTGGILLIAHHPNNPHFQWIMYDPTLQKLKSSTNYTSGYSVKANSCYELQNNTVIILQRSSSSPYITYAQIYTYDASVIESSTVTEESPPVAVFESTTENFSDAHDQAYQDSNGNLYIAVVRQYKIHIFLQMAGETTFTEIKTITEIYLIKYFKLIGGETELFLVYQLDYNTKTIKIESIPYQTIVSDDCYAQETVYLVEGEQSGTWSLVDSTDTNSTTLAELSSLLAEEGGSQLTIPHSIFYNYGYSYTLKFATPTETLIFVDTTRLKILQNPIDEDCNCGTVPAKNIPSLTCYPSENFANPTIDYTSSSTEYVITVTLDPNEQLFPSTNTWTVSSSADTTALENDILNVATGLTITVPVSYLPGADHTYTFTSGYGTTVSLSLSPAVTLLTESCVTKEATFQAGYTDAPYTSTWEVTATDDTNTDRVNALNTYLASQSDPILTLPYNYLYYGFSYTLQATLDDQTETFEIVTADRLLMENVQESSCDCGSNPAFNHDTRTCYPIDNFADPTLEQESSSNSWIITATLGPVEQLFPSTNTWSVTSLADTTTLETTIVNEEDGLTLTIPYSMMENGEDYTFTFTTGYGSTSEIIIGAFLILSVDQNTRCLIEISSEYIETDYLGTMNWGLVSSTSINSDRTNELEDFLASQSGDTLSLSVGYIEEGVTYTLMAHYISVASKNMTAEVTFTSSETQMLRILDDPTSVHVIPMLESSIEVYDFEWVVVDPTYESCGETVNTSLFKHQWTLNSPELEQTSELLRILDLSTSSLLIPDCLLERGVIYSITYEASSLATGDSLTQDFEVEVIQSPFNIQLTGGNKDHSVNEELDLVGTVKLPGSCASSPNLILFSWSCKIGSNESDKNLENCDDPDGLFVQESETVSNLTIPVSYFTENTYMKFTLTVDVEGSVKIVTQSINVVNKAIDLVVSCIAPSDCRKYNQNTDYLLQVAPAPGEQIGSSDYTYKWTITPSNLPGTYAFDRYKLRQNQLTLGEDYVRISAKLISSTSSGSSFLDLPLNQPPQNGAFSVTPITGTSLITQFSLHASGWTDDDIPLRYQFLYQKQGIDTNYKSFGIERTNPRLTTVLSGSGSSVTVNLKAWIIDDFGAISEATATSITVTQQQSFGDASENLFSFLNQLKSQEFIDNEEKLSTFNILQQEFLSIESQLDIPDRSTSDSYCPSCSGHGSCKNQTNVCTCDKGYTLDNCAMEEDVYDQMVETLKQVATVVAESFQAETISDIELASISSIMKSSSSSKLIDGDSINEFKKILNLILLGTDDSRRMLLEEVGIEKYVQNYIHIRKTHSSRLLEQKETIAGRLSVEMLEEIASTISNIIHYTKNVECLKKTSKQTLREAIEESVDEYMDSITTNLVKYSAPDDPALTINTGNFDIITQTLNECSIEDAVFNAENDSPLFEFTRKNQSTPCDSEKIVKVKLVSFNSNAFNCSNLDIEKNLVGIELEDSQGNSLNEEYSAEITPKKGVPCPNSCKVQEIDGPCVCDDLSDFDIKNQLQVLVANSRIGEIANLDALKDWEFYKSFIFYILVAIVLITLLSAILILTKAKKWCVVEQVSSRENPSNLKRIKAIYLSSHPFLNALLYKDKEIDKITRLMMFSSRVIFLMTYASIFLSDAQLSEEEKESGDFKVEPELNPYFLLLPYVTVIPVESLLIFLIKTKPTEIVDGKHVPQKGTVKARVCIGYFLLVLCLAGCVFICFVLDAQSSQNERLRVLVLFLQTFLQDIIITPIMSTIFQVVFLALLLIKKVRTNKKLKQKIEKLMTDNFKDAIGYVQPPQGKKGASSNEDDQVDVKIYFKKLLSRKYKEPPKVVQKEEDIPPYDGDYEHDIPAISQETSLSLKEVDEFESNEDNLKSKMNLDTVNRGEKKFITTISMIKTLKSYSDFQRTETIFTKQRTQENFIPMEGKQSLQDLNPEVEDSSEKLEGKEANPGSQNKWQSSIQSIDLEGRSSSEILFQKKILVKD